MQDHHKRHHDHHAEARRVAHLPREADSEPYLDLPLRELGSRVAVPEPSRIVARDDSTDSASTSTCTSEADPGCKLPVEAHTVQINTIIAVSVVLPIVAIAIVLFFLHRRTTKRQAAEDARDADKDLDFGVDTSYLRNGKKGKKGGQEMAGRSMGYKGHGSGMSIDLGNPYMLPPEVHGSSDSLHSLSRSVADRHDPYRMVKTPSVRSGAYNDYESKPESTRDLLAHSQPISKTPSPLAQDPRNAGIQRKAVPNPFASPDSTQAHDFNFGDEKLAPHEHMREKSVDTMTANRLSNPNKSLPATPANGAISPPPRGDSKSPYAPNNNHGPVDPYSFQEVIVPPSPEAHTAELDGYGHGNPEINIGNFAHPPPPEPEDNMKRLTLGLGLDFAGSRLSVLRPLPPDDPEENPEQRANRIRSFYKEYFSDSDARGYEAGADYYEDYGDEYLQDGTVFDPDSGQFVVARAPYADPITRRAMTPPPRGPPPKFRGGPRRPGHMSSGSSPGMGGPRGRAFSNASTPVGFGPRGRAAKRPLPPPAALQNLPTPALLKEDAFNLTMDFAPSITVADRAAGRSESPFLGERPYAPKFSPASPLASAFQELAVVPSPHSLRKSSTFTALDFAPPPRFRDPESGSDAGSIRSGRSNFSTTSARQKQNIRAGAYRLSRLPKGVVGTRGDIMEDLKPKMGMGY